jgi:hypothetical protein
VVAGGRVWPCRVAVLRSEESEECARVLLLLLLLYCLTG